jgi:ribosomal protein L16 Arg81 hydroxylase
MKQKRIEITSIIETEEQDVTQYDAQAELLQARLDEVKASLMKKVSAFQYLLSQVFQLTINSHTDRHPAWQRALVQEYDKVIGETESAYSKILETSMSLLAVLDKDTLEVHKGRSRHASVSGETDIM